MKAPWIVVVCIATLAGHYVIYANKQMDLMTQLLIGSDKAADLERDNVLELMHANQQLSQELNAARTQAYVTGVLDVMKKPDHYNAIWHAGYDRGMDTSKMMKEAAVQPAVFEEPKEEPEPK